MLDLQVLLQIGQAYRRIGRRYVLNISNIVLSDKGEYLLKIGYKHVITFFAFPIASDVCFVQLSFWFNAIQRYFG